MIDKSNLYKNSVSFLKRHDLLHKSPENTMLSIVDKVIRMPRFQFSTGVWRDYITSYMDILSMRASDAMLTDNEVKAYVGLIENAILLATSKEEYVEEVRAIKTMTDKSSDKRKSCGCIGDCSRDILNKEMYRCDG